MAMETEIRNLLDCHVVGSDGEPIGKVGQVYLNDRTGQPEWLTVRTGFFGMKQTFVPLANARRSGDEIRVPFDKEKIRGAPNIDVDGRLTLQEEADLYRYYGMHPSGVPQPRTGEPRAREPFTGEPRAREPFTGEPRAREPFTGERPEGRPGPGGPRDEPTGRPSGIRADQPADQPLGTRAGEPSGVGAGERDIEMTVSEERLRIGKESRESGRVRLHKYVETEHVTERIPLTHEELVVEREPITDGETAAPQEIREEERQLILHEERPVVGKETRPVERVHVRKRDVRREEIVEGQVRRERLEIDEEGITRGESEGLPPER